MIFLRTRVGVLRQKKTKIQQQLWNGFGHGVEKASAIAEAMTYGPIMADMSVDFTTTRFMGGMGIIWEKLGTGIA
jgi:hypothetical protein